MYSKNKGLGVIREDFAKFHVIELKVFSLFLVAREKGEMLKMEIDPGM
jgi:hypothetical protein